MPDPSAVPEPTPAARARTTPAGTPSAPPAATLSAAAPPDPAVSEAAQALDIKLLLAEYDQIKQEQRARIGFRDNLLYATLAAMAAAVVAALAKDGQAALLLLLPPLCTILGWTYLANDQKISAIGRHVRTTLAPRLAVHLPPGTAVFPWETAHRTDRDRRLRKHFQLGVDLLAFTAAPVAAVTVYAVLGPPHPALITVAVVDLLLTTLLTWQIVRHAETGPRPGSG